MRQRTYGAWINIPDIPLAQTTAQDQIQAFGNWRSERFKLIYLSRYRDKSDPAQSCPGWNFPSPETQGARSAPAPLIQDAPAATRR